MKKIFLAAALAAMTLLASCSKDGNEGLNQEGPQTGMGISFTMPQAAGTRAITGDEITGTADENKFTKLKVFIFNSSGASVTGNNTERVEADFDKIGNTYTLKTNKQIKTTAGSKRIYIGVNLPSGFDNFATEEDLKKATAFTATSLVGSNGAAMMSEVIVATLVTQEDGDVVEPANKVSASVERMVAKVAANTTSTNNKFTSDLDDVTITYEILSWGIGHGTNYMFPAKQLENSRLVTPRNPVDGSPAVGGAPTAMIPISNSSFMNNWSGMSSTYVGENAPKNNLIGESTYAMVQAIATPNKKASIVSDAIQWSAHTFTGGDFWVVRSSGDIYFCESELEGRKVYDFLREDGSSATIQKYEGGYVYFIVWLNRSNTGEELVVKRNQYIHMEISGVKAGFGGIPGAPGSTPPDPTEPTEPDEPDPLDPDEPVFSTDAYLNVDINVKSWVYVKNDTVLE